MLNQLLLPSAEKNSAKGGALHIFKENDSRLCYTDYIINPERKIKKWIFLKQSIPAIP